MNAAAAEAEAITEKETAQKEASGENQEAGRTMTKRIGSRRAPHVKRAG